MRQFLARTFNRELKQKWIAALRSDKYEKMITHFCDKSGSKRCCSLGVLLIEAGYSFDKNCNVIKDGIIYNPYDALNNLGLDPSEVRSIWGMNDLKGFSFKNIADWIEEHI